MRECVCLCSYRRCRQSDLLFPNRIWSKYMYVYNIYIFTAVVENKKRYGSSRRLDKRRSEKCKRIYVYTCVYVKNIYNNKK